MTQTRTVFDQLAGTFEVEWYELALARQPDDLSIINALALAYTCVGRYADGLEMDQKIVAAMPGDSTARYNLACSLSLLGEVDKASQALLIALKLGYDEPAYLLADPDLAALRANPSFAQIEAWIRGKWGGSNG